MDIEQTFYSLGGEGMLPGMGAWEDGESTVLGETGPAEAFRVAPARVGLRGGGDVGSAEGASAGQEWPRGHAPDLPDDRSAGLVGEGKANDGQPLRLLPLLDAVGALPPLSGVIGLTRDGRPLLLRLRRRDTWHVGVSGPPGSGKSELLRTLCVSLALSTSPATLRMYGIAPDHRELAILEGLPHVGLDLATTPQEADQLLECLEQSEAAGMSGRSDGTSLLLVLDDVAWMRGSGSRQTQHRLQRLAAQGHLSGLHILAASRDLSDLLVPGSRGWAYVRTGAIHGRSGFRTAGRMHRIQVSGKDLELQPAWLSAQDLNDAIRGSEALWYRESLEATSGVR